MFQMHVFLNTINRIDIFPYLNIFFREFFFDSFPVEIEIAKEQKKKITFPR